MSETLRGMRRIPGWIKPYLLHIENGDSDPRAASRVEVSSHVIRKKYDNDSIFATDYERAVAKRAARPQVRRF